MMDDKKEVNVSEYIVCKECQKKIEEETYIAVDGDVLDCRRSEHGFGKFCRQNAVYDAIVKLKYDIKFFDKNYIGVKSYDNFGDQREDHELNMGPKHGYIVFKIFLKKKYRKGNIQDFQKIKAIEYLNSLVGLNIDKYGYGLDL